MFCTIIHSCQSVGLFPCCGVLFDLSLELCESHLCQQLYSESQKLDPLSQKVHALSGDLLPHAKQLAKRIDVLDIP